MEAKPNSTSQKIAINIVMESNGLHASELTDEKRKTELKSFLAHSKAGAQQGWLRLQGLGQLSLQESKVVAARLVKRLTTKVSLTEVESEQLRETLEKAFQQPAPSSCPGCNTIEDRNKRLLIEGSKTLSSEQQQTAWKASMLDGYRPALGEE